MYGLFHAARAARFTGFLFFLAVALTVATAAGAAQRAADAGAAVADAEEGESEKPADKPRNVPLPAPADAVIPAGGGRYLLLRLDKLMKLAVYDVAEDKIKGYVPLGAADTLVAGGLDKLVIVARDKGTIQRWSIDPPRKELAAAFLVGQVDGVVMGHASHGPVLAMSRTEGPVLLSLQTLEPLDVQLDPQAGAAWRPNPQHPLLVAASADGQTFAGWCRGLTPSGLRLLRVQGDAVVSRHEPDGAGVLLPSWDGTQLYTSNGVYSTDLRPIASELRGRACLPAYRAGYFLSAVGGMGPGRRQTAVSVYTASDRALRATLPPMAELGSGRDNGFQAGTSASLQWHERIFLVPQHDRLVTLNESRDKLLVRPFDIVEVLDKSGADYLFVESLPVTVADPGKAYEYRIFVQSKNGGVKLTLDSGPDGMTLSEDGVLSWQVPASAEPGPAGVIISVEDGSGQSVFHSFNVNVTGASARPGAPSKRIKVGPAVTGQRPAAPTQPVVRAKRKPKGATAQTDR